MPPIKGRMMGRMGKGGAACEIKRYQDIGMTKRKPRMHLQSSSKMTRDAKDEKLMKLRYPPSIRSILPSVKKYRGVSKSFMNTDEASSSTPSEDMSEPGWEERRGLHQHILGTKKNPRIGGKPKYFVRAVQEEKFKGMIWDLACHPNGDIIISCADGVLICNKELRLKQKLENIVLAGGVSILSDGRIVAICRNTDTVYIFKEDGSLSHSFLAGKSPMAVAVDENNRLIVCDPGAKLVYMYNDEGKLLKSIGPKGDGFNLRWPLYTATQRDCSMLVADCHSQSVLRFDSDGNFNREVRLDTFAGNQVLRPHGICVHQTNNDMFVIDNATHSVEVFNEKDMFVQTLIPSEEGHSLQPKVVCVNEDYVVLGGLTGVVKLYQFVPEQELETKPNPRTLKTPTKRKIKQKPIPKLKLEIKDEIIIADEEEENKMALKMRLSKRQITNDSHIDLDVESGDCDSITSSSVSHVSQEWAKPVIATTEDEPVILLSDSEGEEKGEEEEEEERVNGKLEENGVNGGEVKDEVDTADVEGALVIDDSDDDMDDDKEEDDDDDSLIDEDKLLEEVEEEMAQEQEEAEKEVSEETGMKFTIVNIPDSEEVKNDTDDEDEDDDDMSDITDYEIDAEEQKEEISEVIVLDDD